METFNTFTPYLQSCEKYNNFVILALEGDINKWNRDSYWYRGTEYQYNGYSHRKSDSEKHVDATIWTFDESTQSFSKKSVYRNTKGVFFKTNGIQANIYILKEKLPKNML